MSVRFARPGGQRVHSLAGHYQQHPSFKRNMLENLGYYRQDADEAGSFFLRQLEFIDKRVFHVKYAELPYLKWLPLIGGVRPATEAYTWRLYDRRGRAKWGNLDGGMTVPKSNVSAQEFTTKIRSMISGYGYNIQEMRASAETGLPLEAERADTARLAISELQNHAALFGDTEFGITGLFSRTDTQTYTPSVDTNSVSTWRNSLKTSQQIYNDVIGMIDQVEVVTLNIEHVTQVLMSHSNFKFLSATPYTPGAGFATTQTILQAIQSARPGVKIDWVLGLETAGAGGTSRMIGYNPREDLIGLVLPVPFEMLTPFWTGTGYEIVCHARFGEVVSRYPQSVIYQDGT